MSELDVPSVKNNRSRAHLKKKRKLNNLKNGFVPLSEGLNGNTREPGWVSLAMAVIEQAVIDYFIMHRNGFVNELEYTGKSFERMQGKTKRRYISGIYEDTLKELIAFWRHGHCMKYINLAMIKRDHKWVDGKMLRDGLLKMERIGNIYSQGRAVP